MANSDLNRCDFIGRLGADPEMVKTGGGKTVCKFRIAVNGWQDKPEWVSVVAWDKLGDICGQYLKKGSQIYLSGRMQTREWTDKEGNKRYTTEIIANNMQMLGGKSDNTGAPAPKKQNAPAPPVEDDDLPF